MRPRCLAAPRLLAATLGTLLAPLAAATPLAAQAIFSDGFESGDLSLWPCTHLGCTPAPATCPALTLTTGTTTVKGSDLPSRTVDWRDAACEPRQAVMIDQRNTAPVGAGYLRRYTYRVGGLDRVCTGLDGGVIQGMGYVTNHLGDPGDFGGSWGNWSPGTAGTTSVVLGGPHHAILEYAMPTYQLGGKTIPTTVQWLFATGRSHPLFSLAQDARAHTEGNLGADSRSPYGAMGFAGDANNALQIAGVSWGDTYKFVTVVNDTTDESTLMTSASGWRYDQPNSIPYVLAWVAGADAEQGTVATAPIDFQDQGSDSREWPVTGFGKNQIDLDGPLPKKDDWAYQLMNYATQTGIPANGTTDKKMAWGTQVGALGGFDNWWPQGNWDLQEFSRHRDSTTPWSGSRENGLLLAYSTFVVFGTHSGGYENGTTGQLVQQMENHQLATLSATVGTVRSAGPRGVGPALDALVNYQPPGYNHVYATWEVDSDGGVAELTLAAAVGYPIDDPLFVLHGYSSGAPPQAVSLDGTPGVAGADYYATVDSAAQRLWITVPRTVTGSLQLQVTP